MLSSEFCMVLEEPKKLSALWNSEPSAFGSILKYCINGTSIGPLLGVSIKGVSTVLRLSEDFQKYAGKVYTLSDWDEPERAPH